MLPDIYYPSAPRSLFEVPHFATGLTLSSLLFPAGRAKTPKRLRANREATGGWGD